MMVIYELHLDGHIMYVGKTGQLLVKRLSQHRWDRSDPTITIHEVCHTDDEGRWSEREHIAMLREMGESLPWNKNNGGGGPTHQTAETRARMSASKIGNTNNLGNVASPETREKMAEAHRGIPRSAETRAKIGNGLRGRPKSPEHRANLSAANKRFNERKVKS